MSGTVLILGATGRFGSHAAEAFWNAGWRVCVFDRSADDLITAAGGVDVIVNGWNPVYTDWPRDVPTLTDRVIAAARASGATVIVPGNVYVYGQGSPEVLALDTPKRAANPLGRIRIEMETAYRTSGVRTILLRAGDFIDTRPGGNWFEMIVTGKLHKNRVISPGDPDVPHAWAFLPDLARAAVALAERRETLKDFEEVLFPGFALSLRQITNLIGRATGRSVKLRRMNWLPLWIAAPFWPMGRKLLEMRYLWSMPHRLNGMRFDDLLPDFRATDPLVAIASALAHVQVDPNQAMPGRGQDVAAE